MKYKDTGFRPLYHHFCVFPLTPKTEKAIRNFPGGETANAMVTYGYYDEEEGLTLEVMAAARMNGNEALFGKPLNEIRYAIRIDEVAEAEFMFYEDENGEIAEMYAQKLEMLRCYDAEEGVEKTRGMRFLDSSRDDRYIDCVFVFLLKEGYEMEGCWTKIVDLKEHSFVGVLLSEPKQDFGCHEGTQIDFYVREMEDDDVICYADMTERGKFTIEDLADGSMLEAAVSKFYGENSEQNLLDILEILRDSLVWIPCTAILSDEDQDRIENMLNDNKDNLDELVGEVITNQDVTRLVPDILQNGDEFFFPIFSTREAMGDYGTHFSKVRKHVLEVISLARNNDKAPTGIVLNAFGQSFAFGKEMWDIIEKMESHLQ